MGGWEIKSNKETYRAMWARKASGSQTEVITREGTTGLVPRSFREDE